MCGIVGYIGDKGATSILIDGLKRLEYRGYDSAGVAVMNGEGITIKRTEGKLGRLVDIVNEDWPQGVMGIGHTRWATHGRPSEINAHPHRAGDIVVVHNGIIENHTELRKFLIGKGHNFSSETDTEIICHLIQQNLKNGDILKAFRKTILKLKGSYSIVMINEKEPDRLYVAKQGSPLIIGYGDKENFVASDIPAVLPYTRSIAFFEDGEYGVVYRDRVELFNEEGKEVKKTPRTIAWNSLQAEKGGYKHFMLKEIFEQPKIMEDVVGGRLNHSEGRIDLPEMEKFFKEGKFLFNKIFIVACGTSYHAGMVGRYMIESITRIPVMVEFASEFRYRNPIIDENTIVIPISQSGETADTIASVKLAKEMGATIVSICNVVDSSIPRLSDSTLYTHAGPEIGVASTKAFSAQLVVLFLLALYLGRELNKVTADFVRERIDEVLQIPNQMNRMLKRCDSMKEIAERFVDAPLFLYIARGISFPVALEGALKLKEISYVDAEGFAAGELKHGPIALVDNNVPVVAIAPKDEHYDKVLSNIEEVKARGAKIIGISSVNDRLVPQNSDAVFAVPRTSWYLSPVLNILPLQLLAYYIADHKGTDVDQPRNLAKSVTVE
ncbi:glutamine--fructose-6-phosphate transaminase (isomerizing) [bacterium]|nr:glutamine--fructose-6-phosphate transaminase (isomerizing) [bacterium]